MQNDYLESFCREILANNQSIRFAGIANHLGSLIAAVYRQGLIPLMTKEETSQYSIQAVLRAAIREDFASKIGRLEYSIGKYENLIRATVPIIFGKVKVKDSMYFYHLIQIQMPNQLLIRRCYYT
jgi:hypothetical protein